MSRKINAARLVTLAKFIAPIKEEKFDLRSWGSHDGSLDQHDLEVFGINTKTKKDEVKFCPTADQLGDACGTTACALGWAGTIPEFQKDGLKLEMFAEVYTGDNGKEFVVDSTLVTLRRNKKRVLDTFEAGAAFFGIDEEDSYELFDPARYSTGNSEIQPPHVCVKIGALLFNNGHYVEAGEVLSLPQVKNLIERQHDVLEMSVDV